MAILRKRLYQSTPIPEKTPISVNVFLRKRLYHKMPTSLNNDKMTISLASI